MGGFVAEAYTSGAVNEAIASACRRPGWSQARLAKVLGVRPQTVNKWVSGENTPPIERWNAIEDALGWEQGHLLRISGIVIKDAHHGSNQPAALSGVDLSSLDEVEQAILDAALDAIRARRGAK